MYLINKIDVSNLKNGKVVTALDGSKIIRNEKGTYDRVSIRGAKKPFSKVYLPHNQGVDVLSVSGEEMKSAIASIKRLDTGYFGAVISHASSGYQENGKVLSLAMQIEKHVARNIAVTIKPIDINAYEKAIRDNDKSYIDNFDNYEVDSFEELPCNVVSFDIKETNVHVKAVAIVEDSEEL